MRSGKVYYKDLLAGTIIETNDGEYVFQYDEQYVNDHPKSYHIGYAGNHSTLYK
jgi:serine/threonine-protein kinase HipA